MNEYYFVFLLAVFVAAVGQALLKYAAMRHYDYWWEAYLNIYVISAYILLFCSMLMAIWAYRVLPLFTGVMMETTGYYYIALFGCLLFNERLNLRRVLALGLITGGIGIYVVYG